VPIKELNRPSFTLTRPALPKGRSPPLSFNSRHHDKQEGAVLKVPASATSDQGDSAGRPDSNSWHDMEPHGKADQSGSQHLARSPHVELSLELLWVACMSLSTGYCTGTASAAASGNCTATAMVSADGHCTNCDGLSTGNRTAGCDDLSSGNCTAKQLGMLLCSSPLDRITLHSARKVIPPLPPM